MELINYFQLNTAWQKNRETDENLKILIQVNTSREENKNGVEPEKVKEIWEFISEKCPALQLDGKLIINYIII